MCNAIHGRVKYCKLTVYIQHTKVRRGENRKIDFVVENNMGMLILYGMNCQDIQYCTTHRLLFVSLQGT